MNPTDLFWLSYKQLNEKRTRTILTVVMVVIGVASIVALISLTAGISAGISSSLQTLGPTSIILTSTKASGFTLLDTSGISSLPNVSTVIPIVEGSGTLVTSSENTSVTVIGVDPQYISELLNGVNLYQGTTYNNTLTPSSIIGYDIAFPSTAGGRQEASVGQPATLKIGSGRSITSYNIPVVGVLQSYSSFIISINSAVFMSQTAAQTLLHKSSFNIILVKATNTSSVGPLTTELTDIYGNNARILSTQSLASTINSIIGGISDLLLIIAGISLLVASIGIMNIMLMSVMERTHEIGILKAIGFKSRQVLAIFLFQALIIGAVGGVIGIVAGVGASYSLAALSSHASSSNSTTTSPSPSGATFRTSAAGPGAGGNAQFSGGPTSSSSSASSSFSFTPVLSITTIVEAMLVAIIVSALAGLYPAWRASRMEPIDALRQL